MNGKAEENGRSAKAEKNVLFDRDVLLYVATENGSQNRTKRSELFELLNVPPPLQARGMEEDVGKKMESKNKKSNDGTASPKNENSSEGGEQSGKSALKAVVFQKLFGETQRDPLLHNALLNHDFLLSKPSQEELDAFIRDQKNDDELVALASSENGANLEESTESDKDRKKRKHGHQASSYGKRKSLRLWRKMRQVELRNIANSVSHVGESEEFSGESLAQALGDIVERAIGAEEKYLHANLVAVHTLLCETEEVLLPLEESTLNKLQGDSTPFFDVPRTPKNCAAVLLQDLACQAHNFITSHGDLSKRVTSAHPLTFLLLYSLLKRFSQTFTESELDACLARNCLRILSANFSNLVFSSIAPASVGLGHTNVVATTHNTGESENVPSPGHLQHSTSSTTLTSTSADITLSHQSSFASISSQTSVISAATNIDLEDKEGVLFCSKLGALVQKFALIDWKDSSSPPFQRAKASLVTQATLCWTFGFRFFFPLPSQVREILLDLVTCPPEQNPFLLECACSRLSFPTIVDLFTLTETDEVELQLKRKGETEPTNKIDVSTEEVEVGKPDSLRPQYWFQLILENILQTCPEIAFEDDPAAQNFPEKWGISDGFESSSSSVSITESNMKSSLTSPTRAGDEDEDVLLQKALELSLAAEKQPASPPFVPPVARLLDPYFFRIEFLRGLQEIILEIHGDQPSGAEQETRAVDSLDPQLVLQEARCAETIELSGDGRTATQKSDKDWGTALAQLAMTRQDQRFYRWSVRLDRCEKGHIFIGVASKQANSSTYLGGDRYGWGLIGTKVLWHNRSKLKSFGTGFRTGDIVHVTLDTVNGTLSYACSRNNKRSEWGVAFRNLGDACTGENSLHPAIALYQRGDSATIMSSSSFAASPRGNVNGGPLDFNINSDALFPQGDTALFSYLPVTPLKAAQQRLARMADMNQSICQVGHRLRTVAANHLFFLLSSLKSREGDEKAIAMLLRFASPVISILTLWPQKQVRVNTAVSLLRTVMQLIELIGNLNPFTKFDTEQIDGAWSFAGIDLTASVQLASFANKDCDGHLNSRLVVCNHLTRNAVKLDGLWCGNRVDLVEYVGDSSSEPKRFITLRVLPHCDFMIGTVKDLTSSKSSDIYAFRTDERTAAYPLSAQLRDCRRLLGMLSGKLAAVVSKGKCSIKESAEAITTDGHPSSHEQATEQENDNFNYDDLLRSALLEGGFSQRVIDEFLSAQFAKIAEGNFLLLLSSHRLETCVSNVGTGENATSPKPKGMSLTKKTSEGHHPSITIQNPEEWGLEHSKDVQFLHSFILGEDPSVEVFDQWMMRFAGKSAFISVGGMSMRSARLATIAAMLMHSGVLQEARLLCLMLEQSSDTQQLKDEEVGTQPSRMLISVWRSAQRIIEWAIRSKQQSGSTYTVLAEKILVKVKLLLQLRPGVLPILDYPSLGLQGKLSSSSSSLSLNTLVASSPTNSGFEAGLKVDTAFLGSPTPHSDESIMDMSMEKLGSAEFVDKLLQDNQSLESSSPVSPTNSNRHTLVQVLDQWKRIAKYVTRSNAMQGASRSHSQALEAVVLFIKGQFSAKKLSNMMLQGAWRALQRSVGLNVFSILVGARNRTKHISPKLFGCTTNSLASTQLKMAVLEWLSPSLADGYSQPSYIENGTKFASVSSNSQGTRTEDSSSPFASTENRKIAGDIGSLQSNSTASGASGGNQLPQLSPLDFVDLGLVEKETSEQQQQANAQAKLSDGHYLSNTRGCGRALQHTVRQSFEQVYSTLAADLERASAGNSTDLQLSIIESWSLTLGREDHEFLSRIGIFRIFQQVLSGARQSLANEEEDSGDVNANDTLMAKTVANQVYLLTHQRVMKATLRVVHLLASQVVLNGGVLDGSSSTTFSLRSPTASLLTNLRTHTKPSGVETLGKAVFEMLFNELETALEGMQSNDKPKAAYFASSFIDEEEYCFQVVMLLYTTSVNGLKTCLQYLSSTERIETLLSAATCHSPRIQHRTLRLLSRVLPSIREIRCVKQDLPLLASLWEMIREAYPPSYADQLREARLIEDGTTLSQSSLLSQDSGKAQRRVYEEKIWRACDAVSLVRRLLCSQSWSASVQEMIRSTLKGGEDSVSVWVTMSILGGHFEQLRVCGKVRFSPSLLSRVDESHLDDMRVLTKKSGVLAELGVGPNQESAKVLLRDISSASATHDRRAGSSSRKEDRGTIRLMSATIDAEMLIPVAEVDISSLMRLDEPTQAEVSSYMSRVLRNCISWRKRFVSNTQGESFTPSTDDEEEPRKGDSEDESDTNVLELFRKNEDCVFRAHEQVCVMKALVELMKAGTGQDLLQAGVFQALLELASSNTETAGMQDLSQLESWWRATMAEYYRLHAKLIHKLQKSLRKKFLQNDGENGSDSRSADPAAMFSGDEGSSKPNNTDDDDEAEDDEDEDMSPALRTMLELGLGFQKQVCQLALERCGNNVEAAIEYCIEHAMDMDVLVEAAQQQATQSSNEDASSTRRSVIVEKLVEMGFPERWCERAIDTVGENFDNALTWILSNGEILHAQDEREAQETAQTAEHSQSMEDAQPSSDSNVDAQSICATNRSSLQASVNLPSGVGVLTSTSGLDAIDITEEFVVSVKPSSFGFPSVGARDLLLTGGCWYYEVTLMTDNCMQIGWADAAFTGNATDGDGVGDDGRSWSFDGYRKLFWHTRSEPWGRKWRVGDVVCAAIDLEAGDIWFGLNGEYDDGMGCMVRGLCRDKDYIRGLFPAVSLNRTEKLQFNFGTRSDIPFKFLPPNALETKCRPIAESFLSVHNIRSHLWFEQIGRNSRAHQYFHQHLVEDCMEEEVPSFSSREPKDRFFQQPATAATRSRQQGETAKQNSGRGVTAKPSKRKSKYDVRKVENFSKIISLNKLKEHQLCSLKDAVAAPRAAASKLEDADLNELISTILSMAYAMTALYARMALVLLLDKWDSLDNSLRVRFVREVEVDHSKTLIKLLKLASCDLHDQNTLGWVMWAPSPTHHDLAVKATSNGFTGQESSSMFETIPLLERLRSSLGYLLSNLLSFRESMVDAVALELARSSMRLFASVNWCSQNYILKAHQEAKQHGFVNLLKSGFEIFKNRTGSESRLFGDLEAIDMPEELPFQDSVISALPNVSFALWFSSLLLDLEETGEGLVKELHSAWSLAMHSSNVVLKTIAARQLCNILQKHQYSKLVDDLVEYAPIDRIRQMTKRFLERTGTTAPIHSRYMQVLAELCATVNSVCSRSAAQPSLSTKDTTSAALADYDDMIAPIPQCVSGTMTQYPILDLPLSLLPELSALTEIHQEEEKSQPSIRELVLADTKVGDLVIRGPSWANGDEDGGPGSVGMVIRIDSDGVLVDWGLIEKHGGNGTEDILISGTESSAVSSTEEKTGEVTVNSTELDHEDSADEDDDDPGEENEGAGAGESANNEISQSQTSMEEAVVKSDSSSARERGHVKYSKIGSQNGEEWEIVLLKLDTANDCVTRIDKDELLSKHKEEKENDNLRRKAFRHLASPGKTQTDEDAVLGDRLRLGALLWFDEPEKVQAAEQGSQVTGTLELPEFKARIAVSGEFSAPRTIVLYERHLIQGTGKRGWRSRFGRDYWQPGTKYTLDIKPDGSLSGAFEVCLPGVRVKKSVNEHLKREQFCRVLQEVEEKEIVKTNTSNHSSASSSVGSTSRAQPIVIQRNGAERSFAVELSAFEDLGDAELLEALLRPLMGRGQAADVDIQRLARRTLPVPFTQRRASFTQPGRDSIAPLSVSREVETMVTPFIQTVKLTVQLRDGTAQEMECPTFCTLNDALLRKGIPFDESSEVLKQLPSGNVVSKMTALVSLTGKPESKSAEVSTVYIHVQEKENSSEETLNEEKKMVEAEGDLEEEDLIVSGWVEFQTNHLFKFSQDAKGASMVLSEDDALVTLGGFDMDSRGVALGNVGFSCGVHYWEAKVEHATQEYGSVFIGVAERPSGVFAAGSKMSFLKRWDRPPSSYGYVNFRATLETHSSHGQGSEQIYGEFYGIGDTVGVCLDMEQGILSFFLDGIKYGQHTMKDLGIAFSGGQLQGKCDSKMDTSNPLTLYPMVAFRRPKGNSVKVSTKWMSIPRRCPDRLLNDISLIDHLLRECWLSSLDSREPAQLPDIFLERAWRHYKRWNIPGSQRLRRYQARAHGQVVEVDTSRKACEEASGKYVQLENGRKGFRAGDRVRILQSCGRDLESPEEAVVIGAFRNRIWYRVESQQGGHEGMEEGAASAWYWTPEELGLLEVLDMAKEPSEGDLNPEDTIQTFNEFREVAGGKLWSLTSDIQLVQYINERCNVFGVDPSNLSMTDLESLSLYVPRAKQGSELSEDENPTEKLTSTVDPDMFPQQEVGAVKSNGVSTLSKKQVRGRAAVLRLLNCLIRRSLPFVSFEDVENPNSGRTMGWVFSHLRKLIFTSTKKGFWESTLTATTTHTPLANDEYDDPPQIRMVNINRIRAAPPKLASIGDPNARLDASVFGQLFGEISKWNDHTLRRAHVGKGHGGQKRSFKVKFLGEGVKDYGGPYRAVFEQVADELENDREWHDSRMACLLPLFMPSPNRYNSAGDVGRDKFVFNSNPQMQSLQWQNKFSFLGKLVGMAVRHGLQMGLDLPTFYWRWMCNLRVSSIHLEEVDKVFLNTIEVIRKLSESPSETGDRSAEAMAEALGVDRFMEVALSDGSLVPVVSGGSEIGLDYDNAPLYVEKATMIRLYESLPQMKSFKTGLAAVVPVELFSLFTERELEILICGQSEMDINLLKQCTEYEGVSPSDPHVEMFWEVLEEMTADQRTEFLRFAWARSRMPDTAADMPMNFKVTAPTGGAVSNPDEYLPSAQTCFFSLALPKYSNKDVMKAKLRYAIKCTLMDNDFRPMAAEGWADV